MVFKYTIVFLVDTFYSKSLWFCGTSLDVEDF